MKTSAILILIVAIMFIPQLCLGQGGPPATPIDGGLSILLALGGAYGIKRLVKNKNTY